MVPAGAGLGSIPGGRNVKVGSCFRESKLEMLVLARQLEEVIMIGDDIQVTVVAIRGDKIRLGITAPKDVGVHRKEVYDAIRRENRREVEKAK